MLGLDECLFCYCWLRMREEGWSLAMTPSRMVTTRWAYSAMSGSWVTTTMVLPLAWRSSKRAMISSPVLESRFPVGSSARMMEGLVDEGAGDGDALTLAAGELVGLVHHASAQVDGLEDGLCAGSTLDGRSAVVDEGQLDVVKRSGAGEQVEGLEYEANLLVADAGKLVVV